MLPPMTQQPALDAIELSSTVVKWLASADHSYRVLFQKKIALLAEGNRSYALSKRLQGCVYPVFETKLDDGWRILWTVNRRDNASSLMVNRTTALLSCAILKCVPSVRFGSSATTTECPDT